MKFLEYGFFLWVALITFYTLYLAAVNLWDNRSLTSKWVLVFGSPVLAVMLSIDFMMQISLFTLMFLDLPREPLVTDRLKRYRAITTPNWRTTIATIMCTQLLNPFDPTKHHC